MAFLQIAAWKQPEAAQLEVVFFCHMCVWKVTFVNFSHSWPILMWQEGIIGFREPTCEEEYLFLANESSLLLLPLFALPGFVWEGEVFIFFYPCDISLFCSKWFLIALQEREVGVSITCNAKNSHKLCNMFVSDWHHRGVPVLMRHAHLHVLTFFVCEWRE